MLDLEVKETIFAAATNLSQSTGCMLFSSTSRYDQGFAGFGITAPLTYLAYIHIFPLGLRLSNKTYRRIWSCNVNNAGCKSEKVILAIAIVTFL